MSDEDQPGPSARREAGNGNAGDNEKGSSRDYGSRDGSSKAKRELSEKKLEKLKQDYERRGVVYLSRLPPHLKPQKLRHVLQQHAEIGRLYLAPEDDAARRKRKKGGGNSGKNFTEGWVEFEDKAEAKRVAALLNGQPMGGARRSAHFYDLWTIKYLPKFKWDHLTDEINYQKAVREQRMEAEVSAAKRERDFYLSRVDRAKGVEAILERRKRKLGDAGDGGGGAGGGGAGDGDVRAGSADGGGAAAGAADRRNPDGRGGGGGVKVLRTYGQRKAKPDPVTDAEVPVMSESVLRLIAGKQRGN